MSDREVQKLILENGRLKANSIGHCRGCVNLTVHSCGAFYWCSRLGAVDPDVDGCSKREE